MGEGKTNDSVHYFFHSFLFMSIIMLTTPERRKLMNKAVYTSRSRVRVGRGSDEIDQLDGLAGAVTPKPPVNAERS